MAFTQHLATFSAPLNRDARSIVTQFTAFFSATSTAIIQDVEYTRLQSPYGANDLHLRVAYGISTLAGLSYEMRYYATTDAQTAQDAFNADFEAGLCAVPVHVLDVTDHEVAMSARDQFLVILADTDRGVDAEGNGLVGDAMAVFVAEPLGNIAAGAVGAARIYDANGVIVANSHNVRNIDSHQWVLGERNFIIYDLQSGGYIGIPSCCGASALTPQTTTTTAPPVPCISQEVVSVDPRTPGLNAWA